jgi:hypothetical protein
MRSVFPTTLPAPSVPAHAPILARAQALLARLTHHARIVLKTAAQLCEDLIDAPLPAPGAPDAQAEPLACAASAARAIHWAIALSRVLAGTLRIAAPVSRAHPPATPPNAAPPNAAPHPPAAPPAPKPKRRPTKAQSAARWMRHVFATRSIGYIAAHICADLGIDYDDDDLWPDELVAITQTPADYSAMLAAHPAPPQPATAPQPDSSPLPSREGAGEGAGAVPSNQPSTTPPPDDPTAIPAPSIPARPPPDATTP